MVNSIEEYIAQLEGQAKQWLDIFVKFMKENHPEINGTISYQMPMYKFGKQYIAFSAAKEHFTLHCLDFDKILDLKEKLPKGTKFGKGCAKVKYTDKEAVPILFDFCNELIKKYM